ncbi:MATE family efflux transporter [Streptococcus mutans]|uniref:MATE family efflux transporter n=1 Tax=Streptococcus mutans TaxID=1309 RepID=UPI0002BE3114|nr:MATE family efflux transporter [Streptococcus mutans]EMP66570.1 putative multidrug-resistance efflux pump [Streptococcus mutans NCTC 11060]
MNKLERSPIRKLLIQLIIPSLVTAVVSGSYNLVDGIFIGQALGIVGNSANAYTFMIYALVYSFSALASEGTASLLTIALGENNNKRAEKILNTSVLISVVLSVIQSILIWVGLNYLLALFGTPSHLYHYIQEFSLVFLIGSPIYFVSHTLLYCIRAQGAVKKVLYINLASFVVNTGAGAVFILVFNMGFTGSALSTVLANLITLIMTCHEYVRVSSSLKLKVSFMFSGSKKLRKKIISMGLPFFLTTIISVLLLTLYNRIALIYAGSFGIAALSIVSSIYRYIVSLMNAITNGVQPVISFNYGAGKNIRVQEGLRDSLIIGTLFSSVLFGVIQLYSREIAGFFNSENEEFVAFASEALKLVMISLPLQGIINIGTNYFQYISRARVSTILVVLRQIVLQVPLAILLPLKFNISGLWASYYIADVLIFLVIVVWLIKSTKMTDI